MRDPVFRAAVLILGLALLTGSAFIRYSDALLSAQNGQVTLGFLGGTRVSVWLVWSLALVLIVGLALFTKSGKRALHGLLGSSKNRAGTLFALVLFLLTVLPLPYSRGESTDQSIIVYLVLGSTGIICLMLALGRAVNFLGRAVLGVYSRLLNLRPLVFVTGSALFVFLASNLISWLVFEHVPRIHDNVAQLFQARLFAQGKLYAASPPLPQFFDLMLMVNNGRWYSQYPPGHPLLLALGVLVKAPWLINPLLGSLTLVLVYLLGKELYEEKTARLGALLFSLSPFLYLMSSQFMNHSSALFFAALFMFSYFRALRVRNPLYSLLAGLALGMVVLVRPYTAFLIALPFIIDALFRLLKTSGRDLPRLGLMLTGGVVMVVALMLYNQLTNGNPWQLGYIARYGAGHGLGLDRGGWSGPGYHLPNALKATSLDLNAANRYLFEFPIPSLLFVFVLFLSGPARRGDRILLGTFLALVVGHFFYWWHDLLFGPRWEYEALPALVLLSAQGIRVLPRFIRERLKPGSDQARSRSSVAGLLALCYISMFAVALPNVIAALPGTFGIQTSTLKTVQRAGLKQALVFTPRSRYGDVFLAGQVPPGGNIIFARDLVELNPLLSQQFPGRKTYYANLDTLRELPLASWTQTPLKAGLDSVLSELNSRGLQGYRYLFWPVEELRSMVQPLADRYGVKVLTYRQLDQLCVGKTDPLQYYTPALAIRVIGDKSEDLLVFSHMDSAQDFKLKVTEFRLIGTSPNRTVALWDVRAPGVRR